MKPLQQWLNKALASEFSENTMKIENILFNTTDDYNKKYTLPVPKLEYNFDSGKSSDNSLYIIDYKADLASCLGVCGNTLVK